MQHLHDNLNYNTLWTTNGPPVTPLPENAEKSIYEHGDPDHLTLGGDPIDPHTLFKRASQTYYHENPVEAVAQDAIYVLLGLTGITQFDEYTTNLFRKKYTTSQAIIEGVNTGLSMGVPEDHLEGEGLNEINNTAHSNDIQPGGEYINEPFTQQASPNETQVNNAPVKPAAESTGEIPNTRRGGGANETTGYDNKGQLQKHLDKRKKQGYNFSNFDQMEAYGKEFFQRTGDNIYEFTDLKDYIHRLDVKTQEYGILTPDHKIQTVFKVEPLPNSGYKNGTEYMLNEQKKWGTKTE